MSAAATLLALLMSAGAHDANAGELPVCGNRVIQGVMKRVGCTVGDTACWYRSGGFCTDYVERRLASGRARASVGPLAAVPAEEVQPGDVAVFARRAHSAFVERVARDGAGAPVAVFVAEFNYGTCWVDPAAMVTERYGVLGRRRVELRAVDGGFLRVRPPRP